MGHFQKTGNLQHDNAVNLAEGARQAAVAAAAQSAAGQKASDAAEIAYHDSHGKHCGRHEHGCDAKEFNADETLREPLAYEIGAVAISGRRIQPVLPTHPEKRILTLGRSFI
jgi:hypothetical protein